MLQIVITLLIVFRHCLATLTLSAFNVFVSDLNENDASVLGGCEVGLISGMNDYRMTSSHSNAFQHSVPCMFAVRHPMHDLKEGVQSSCSC